MGATPQGNSSFAGIAFEIINRSANPVVVGGQTYAVGEVVMTITTDEIRHMPAPAMRRCPTAPTRSERSADQ